MTHLKKNKHYYTKIPATLKAVNEELRKGLTLLNKIGKPIITFFGSHRTLQSDPNYKHAKKLAHTLGTKNYAILTGGGPGIMKAANTGARQAKSTSLGFRAQLLKEQHMPNTLFTHTISLRHLFTRRFLLAIKSEALIFYPGAYGTLNELFEYLTLIQTGMVDKVPLICVNKKYWTGLFNWMKKHPLKEDYLHQAKDLELITFADNHEEIIKLIEK